MNGKNHENKIKYSEIVNKIKFLETHFLRESKN